MPCAASANMTTDAGSGRAPAFTLRFGSQPPLDAVRHGVGAVHVTIRARKDFGFQGATMTDNGRVGIEVRDGIGWVTFMHPKSNSLPGSLLREIAAAVTRCGEDDGVRVVVLRSEGEKAFCAGASFDELTAIRDEATGKDFFMGFAVLILAMKRCPKFVLTRVQGKAVGGGVGVVAASDYALAFKTASIKLSELALGLGPFVVGPAVERKIGVGPFSAMASDADWRDAAWAERHGLYARLYDSIAELDSGVDALAARLAAYNPEAMAMLKKAYWEGTEHWDRLLEERAVTSGRLVLSKFTSEAIAAFAARVKPRG